jgi:dipeptidyl aminopeptidase/acylaminoacyl peptidase
MMECISRAGLFLTLALLLLTTSVSAADALTLTPERAVKFRRISDLHFSPEGSSAIFVVSEVNGPALESHLWLADLRKQELRQFTFSPKSERTPQWAPQGDRLAFLSNRAGAAQVYVIPRAVGEARAVTTSASGVTDFRWSADGQQIAYLARQGDSEHDPNAPHIADRDQDIPRLWVLDV